HRSLRDHRRRAWRHGCPRGRGVGEFPPRAPQSQAARQGPEPSDARGLVSGGVRVLRGALQRGPNGDWGRSEGVEPGGCDAAPENCLADSQRGGWMMPTTPKQGTGIVPAAVVQAAPAAFDLPRTLEKVEA